jgi:hypothetical protein
VAGKKHLRTVGQSLAPAEFGIGAIGQVKPQNMDDGLRMLPEALTEFCNAGQRLRGAANFEGLSVEGVALHIDGDECSAVKMGFCPLGHNKNFSTARALKIAG